MEEYTSYLGNEVEKIKKKKRKQEVQESHYEIADEQTSKKKMNKHSDSLSSLDDSSTKGNSILETPRKKKKTLDGSPTKGNGILETPSKKKKRMDIYHNLTISPKKNKFHLVTDNVVNNDSSQSEVFKSPSKKLATSFKTSSDSEEEIQNYKSFLKASSPLKISPKKEEHLEDKTLKEGGIFGWTKDEMVTLINKMMEVIPARDKLKFHVRSKKIDWTRVEFGDHSAGECSEQWSKVEPLIRSYRIMKEILTDALNWLDNPKISLNKEYPDMPKKPLTSYMLFVQERRDKLVKKHPEKSLIEVSKLLGEKFRALSEEKKTKYVEKAKQLALLYKDQMETYMQNHPEVASLIKSKNKAPKEEKLLPPKKPEAPFKLYCMEKLPSKGEDVSLKDFTKKIKREWNQLSSKKKIPWIKQSQEKEKEYLEAFKTFVEEHPDIPVKPISKSIISKDEEKILERLDGKPDVPPRSAYSLFSSLMLQDRVLKESTPLIADRVKEIGKLWQMVSEEEKQSYTDKVKQMNEEYTQKYNLYVDSLTPDKKAQELSKTKKLKQTSLFEAFSTEKKSTNKSKVEKNEERRKEESSDDSDDNDFHDSKNVEKIKKYLDAVQPSPPPKRAFEVYRKHYITKRPGTSESKIYSKWEGLSDESKDKYIKTFEQIKADYLLKFKQFIGSLSQEELKVFKTMDQKAENTSFTDLEDTDDSD